MVFAKILIILLVLTIPFTVGYMFGKSKNIDVKHDDFITDAVKDIQSEGESTCSDKDFKFSNAFMISSKEYVSTCYTESPCKMYYFTGEI